MKFLGGNKNNMTFEYPKFIYKHQVIIFILLELLSGHPPTRDGSNINDVIR